MERSEPPTSPAGVLTRQPEPVPSRLPTASFAVVVPVPRERGIAIRYAVAVGVTMVALAVAFPIAAYLQRVIFVLFWPAVIGAAWFGGVGPAILSSVLSVLLADYFLIGAFAGFCGAGACTPTAVRFKAFNEFFNM